MLIIKASLAFKKSNISEKVIFGGNVTNALTADAANPNPLFPDLPIPINKLVDYTTELAEAGNSLVNGGRTARQIANAAIIVWNNAFTTTANYVSMLSDNNPLTVSLSGFLPTKGTREKKPIPGVATTFKAGINGTKGAILAGSLRRVTGAKAHVVLALPAGVSAEYQENTVIISAGEQKIYLSAFTAKNTELYSLESGKPYAVSMFSFNTAGLGPATPAQEVIPQ